MTGDGNLKAKYFCAVGYTFLSFITKKVQKKVVEIFENTTTKVFNANCRKHGFTQSALVSELQTIAVILKLHLAKTLTQKEYHTCISSLFITKASLELIKIR